MRFLKMSKLKAFWNSQTMFAKVVMVITLPIFAIVAGIEHLIAKITGTTYNEVNIIVYYLVIPLSWTIMLDYITRMPFLTPLFLLAWIVFIWKDKMDFRTRCDLAFKKSVDFLLWFQKIGWNYITRVRDNILKSKEQKPSNLQRVAIKWSPIKIM